MEQHGKACLPTSSDSLCANTHLQGRPCLVTGNGGQVCQAALPTPRANEHGLVTLRDTSYGMMANESATLFISQIWDLAFQTCRNLKLNHCFFYSFRTITCMFTTDGSNRGLQLSVTSDGGLMIELRISVA